MFEAYKIGVELSLKSNVSRLLVGISGEFKGVNKDILGAQSHLDAFHDKLLKIQRMGAIGGGLAMLGFGGLSLLEKPYQEAKKLAQAQADFMTMNLSAAQNAEAFGAAATLSHKVLGTTITDNLKTIHDLHTAFGDLPHAIKAAQKFAEFGVMASIMNDGKPVDGLTYAAAKALEHRGQKVIGDDATFDRELDLMERVYQGSRRKVNPNEFFQASQTGKMAYTLMDADELYGPFAAYMQSKSGATAGTAAMTFMSSLVGGHMTNKAKGFLADIGLWEEGVSKSRMDMLKTISQGMSKADMQGFGMLLPVAGGLKSQYMDMAVHQQSEFIQTVLEPAIRKRFGLDLSDEAVATMLMANFNRNTSDFMGEYIVNAMKFKKDAAIFGNSSGMSAYDLYMKSPEGAEFAAQKAWTNFMTVIGTIYLPKVTDGLLWLAKSLDKLSVWTEAHPDLTKNLVMGFGALAGALAFGGTVTTLTAGFKGLGLALDVASLGKLGAVGGGLAEISGVAGLAGLGATLGTIAGGLGLLAGVTAGMGWLLTNVVDPDTDELNHPGKRRHHHRGHPDTWDDDSTAPGQEHKGMHFLRYGRGGSWVPDAPVAPLPAIPPVPDHKGYHFVGRGASGQWIKDGEQAPAESQKTRTRPDQASVIHNHFYVDGKEIASAMMPSKTTGTPDFNPAALMALPSMGNFGLPS